VRPRRRWFVSWLLLAAVTCAAPAGAPPAGPGAAPARRPAPLHIDFVAVGQGDAALVTGPTGKTVLIDGGPRVAGPALAAQLRARHVSGVDLVLLTHRHEDHLGGIGAVVRAFPVRLFMDSTFPHASQDYERLLLTLRERHVMVVTATKGRTIDLGDGAVLTLLGPPDPPLTRSRSDVNANSVVARLDYRNVGVLFAHHGARSSSTAPFLDAVAPVVAVVSVGAVNEYGHPTPEALGRLARAHASIYRTDQDGTVTVETDGTHIEVTTARGKREIIRPR
jgi:beta-lactamase superfamily II metal-dependent hydrolase